MAQKKENKPNSGLYVAVFFVFVILIVIMFFVKKDNIVSNLKKTNFFERVGVSTPEFVEKHPGSTENSAQDNIEIDLMGDGSAEKETEKSFAESAKKDNPQSSKTQAKEIAQTETNISEKTSGETHQSDPSETTEKSKETAKSSATAEIENQKKTETASSPQKSATRTATLYFVSIGSDGSINRAAVKRQLPKSDSPLTDAIKALLAGPVPGEKNSMSLIPAGSKLIGASVKNGIATLNFNENFEFNTYGVEGSIGQLMQIVYTSTEFSTVKSVQFLIEGEKKDYLGSEGQWIGTPLSRSSFN